MVLGIGFLLLVSLVVATAVSAIGTWATGLLPGGRDARRGCSTFVVSFALITLLFAMIFKVLPDVKIAWRDVWIGAVVTALLFTIGKFLIGLYLAKSSVASTYGAAGSLVIVLLWIYYSSQILFLGAELTQVYATRYGSQIRPSKHAVPVVEQKEVASPASGRPPKKRGRRSAPRTNRTGRRRSLEADPHAELGQALLALQGIAREGGGLDAGRVAGGIEDHGVAGGVLLVEEVEHLADQLEADGADVEGLRQPQVELRERVGPRAS